MEHSGIIKINQEFGEKLLTAAKRQVQGEAGAKLLEFVADVARQHEETLVSIEWCHKVKVFLEQKLEAIEKGEFEYNPHPGFGPVIIFKDKRLNATQPERY